MLLIEFQTEINNGYDNILKYRNVNEYDWYYMYIDVESLNLLVENFGIVSTIQIPTIYRCVDNPTTGKEINLNYCGANIKMNCGNDIHFYLPLLEQNY